MKAVSVKPAYEIPWTLETRYCHDGMPLSNGVFGALVWFQAQTVMLTINRADYWDHRGGTEWLEDCTYDHLKSLLQSGDFNGARRLYPTMIMNGKEKRPTRLAMGRCDIKLKPGVTFEAASLRLDVGEAVISCQMDGKERLIRVSVAIDRPMLLLSADEELIEGIEAKPAYSFEKVKTYFDDFGISAPRSVQLPDGEGWVQELPEDPACAVLHAQQGSGIAIAAEYGDTAEHAIQAALERLNDAELLGYEGTLHETKNRWRALWEQAADISLPDRNIENMYYLGIYRMLGNSMPGKIAPTLQGPWAEEYRNPPWSCDYHFNINVQECLWPAYGANLLDCLKPLFTMIDGWKPTLARNAKRFVGIDDGYMLGHSVDERGRPVGGMWTGTIDQANTSWVAQMMWQYARYAGDTEYLVNEVYPFMRKALNVFYAMMDKEGDEYALPVSVSPEYGGSSPNGLGRNSTFFLVNVHFLCEKLLELEGKYRLDADYAAFAADVQAKLPAFTAGPRQYQEFGTKPGLELYLWEGQPLSDSHRHHSHLAGIYPFDTMDMSDPEQREMVSNSYKSWVDKGMGRWAGWSMPWASILHNRLGRADMALLSLHLLKDVYMMPSYATRHNANYGGFCQFTGGDTMQVEASIAAAAAVLEMYVQCVRGTIRVFTGLASRFKDASFSGIRAEGAFLLSGLKRDGKVCLVTVFSEREETLRIENPFGGMARIRRGSRMIDTSERLISLELHAGETVVFENTGEHEGG
ncbi:glycosyl hydrolase family 95 catalytic domain-containing protein [Paenibacillus sp. LPE1-1-1.1]|uniref:glycosyl hydrolase family 95 catalytic domain-containing protein n=1 Tax=Paenibacillus sp. LPE1-1-1.1 TaxID=3135230 RepID=UPI00343A2DA0